MGVGSGDEGDGSADGCVLFLDLDSSYLCLFNNSLIVCMYCLCISMRKKVYKWISYGIISDTATDGKQPFERGSLCCQRAGAFCVEFLARGSGIPFLQMEDMGRGLACLKSHFF